MARHQKAERTGGMYTNRSEYFKKGKDPGLYEDKGSAHYMGGEELADGYSRVPHQDAPDPVAYTQSKRSRKGGGFDFGPKEYIYKKVKEKAAPAPKEESPEPEYSIPTPVEEKPIEFSPEVAQAKERVNNWKGSIDGTAGSTIGTSTPAETNTSVEMPNEEQAQSLANKYKLNLLNKGAGQADFSGV